MKPLQILNKNIYLELLVAQKSTAKNALTSFLKMSLGKIFVLLFIFLTYTAGNATDLKKMSNLLEKASSRERILYLCITYDDSLQSRSPKEVDVLFNEWYSIAAKKNDVEFKKYLDFYATTKSELLTNQTNPDEVFAKRLEMWQKVLERYQAKEDKYFVAICHSYIGHIYFLQKEYAKSLETLIIADKEFMEIEYQKFPDIGKHLHNIALIFYFFKDYEKVAELMEYAIQLPIYDRNLNIQRFNTLAAAYFESKQYKKAEKAFTLTLKTAALYKDPLWQAIASRGIAKIYLNEGKYAKAFELYENTLQYIIDVNKITNDLYKREYSEHLLGLAKCCIFLNDRPKAKQYLERINYTATTNSKIQMMAFGVEYQDINYWLNYYDVLHRYHFAVKNYEKAYFYSDSLYTIRYKADKSFNGLEVQVAENRIESKGRQYENDKKEAKIKSKNRQMVLIGSLFAIIAAASILLFLQNRKIKARNKIINAQLAELSKTLEQRQMLLSELQHRVKNNLQHVISILEIQKESVDFNNIDELIRGNQNRIHSMALLHKKLNVSDNVNDVNLKRYVTELSELVKDSYDNHKKKISLNIKCDVDTISIEKALPLGLILTELVSNSMKHAFKKQNIGIITIEITKNEAGNIIYYADNGIGFDFNKTNEKGLGQEIIKGLIDQLDGTVGFQNDHGFEISISFK